MLCPCWLAVVAVRNKTIHKPYNPYMLTSNKRRGEVMKKLVLQLFVIGVLVATYALPVLAGGGGGP
jgi:hypothetical protein